MTGRRKKSNFRKKWYSPPLIIEKSTQLLSSRGETRPFRVCCIGCGDEKVDYYWLSAILKEFSNYPYSVCWR